MGVDDETAERARRALLVLADLTPAAARPDRDLSVPLEWFEWLDEGLQLLTMDVPPGPIVVRGWPDQFAVGIPRARARRLAGVQQLRKGSRPIRVGWLWLAGTAEVTPAAGGQPARRQVFHPLVTRPVRVTGSSLVPDGDLEISPLVSDRDLARDLEDHVELGGGAFTSFNQLTPALLQRLPKLTAYARRAAEAAGFPDCPLSLDRSSPQQLMQHDGLRVVVGLGIYAVDEPERTTRAGGLLAWPDRSMSEPTAFHAVYAGLDGDDAADRARPESPLPLTARQREAMVRSRTSTLTVISGAPGTGKSHTLTAIVADALRRGESVLVAAKSDAAVDALVDLLDRQPGLTPVVFGSSERRARLAQRLTSGELDPVDDDRVGRAARLFDAAVDARDEALHEAQRSLHQAWLTTSAGRVEWAAARELAPGAFDGVAVPAELVDRAVGERDDGGWWRRWRQRRARRRLRALVGAPASAPVADVVEAVDLARRSRPPVDPTAPADAVAQLRQAEDEVSRRLVDWLAVETRSSRRLDRKGLAAIATLATALRSGRGARRDQLARLSDTRLTHALPVWLGTLGDVDDLLPPVPALFDLVLIDEASATEQTAAAAALLRARRAVIVGDPRQLRHVSFVGDDTMRAVFASHEVDGADAVQLDVRRNSVFDAATAASPAILLDEHFRSEPHLIDVVARWLYEGRLHVATRTPLSHSSDCISLHRVDGRRTEGGVVATEIDAVVEQLRGLATGQASVGIVTPFRAQADELERTLLAEFTPDQLEALDARVGTVHAFQGHERDLVLLSLGLTDDDRAGWRFTSDPHLLAVMLTRARHRMVVMASCTPEPGSLLGRYVEAADTPPGPPRPAAETSPWTHAVADDLRTAGLDVAEAYPTGRHVVDLVTVSRGRPIAIVCELHPDGIDAHIDRHLALQRAGWTVIDALEADWSDDRAARAIALARQLT